MNLGKIIRHLREQKSWSQDELAFKVDTSAANISRIETGKHWPGTKLLKDIAKTFGIRVYQLIALAEGVQIKAEGKKFDHDEEEVIKYFRAMPVEQRELFKAIGVIFSRIKNKPTTR